MPKCTCTTPQAKTKVQNTNHKAHTNPKPGIENPHTQWRNPHATEEIKWRFLYFYIDYIIGVKCAQGLPTIFFPKLFSIERLYPLSWDLHAPKIIPPGIPNQLPHLICKSGR